MITKTGGDTHLDCRSDGVRAAHPPLIEGGTFHANVLFQDDGPDWQPADPLYLADPVSARSSGWFCAGSWAQPACLAPICICILHCSSCLPTASCKMCSAVAAFSGNLDIPDDVLHRVMDACAGACGITGDSKGGG